MYLGIDVGGTKTLIAVLNDEGVKQEEIKLATEKDYSIFLENIEDAVKKLGTQNFIACGVGIPATGLDRENGVAHSFGNLPWREVEIKKDLEQIVNCPVIIENDAKLAALSESMLLKDRFSNVLYVTVSTGIGFGFISDKKIDTNVGDGGGRTLLVEHNGEYVPWEDFAGGRAIYEIYGKQAKDISDEKAWRSIAENLAKGFVDLIAILQPEVIVIGGSVGNYFNNYADFLREDINKYKIPKITMPELMKAQRPDEAVIFGCYDIAKQYYPYATTHQ